MPRRRDDLDVFELVAWAFGLQGLALILAAAFWG
jgi:hypothetical protein